MSLITKSTGAALAIAAASLVGCTGYATDKSASATNDVHCYGVNKCKGTGACGGKGHGCAGGNSCAGQGYLSIDKDTCLKIKGGSLTPVSADKSESKDKKKS